MIITISREYGSGGHTIGKGVAKELGIEFYDRDIIRVRSRKADWSRPKWSGPRRRSPARGCSGA
jgi:cytidylate kinase